MKIDKVPERQHSDLIRLFGSQSYQVWQLPGDWDAWIASFDSVWKIRQRRDGIETDWEGSFATADDALAELQRQSDIARGLATE